MPNYKVKPTIPDWLLQLPKGDYFIEDLKIKLRVARTNILMRFHVLGVERSYMRIRRSWRCVYHWQGSSYYIIKFFKLNEISSLK